MIIKGRAEVKIYVYVSTFLTSYWQEIIQSQVTFQGSSVGFIALARKCIQAVLEVDSKVVHIHLEVKNITLLSVIGSWFKGSSYPSWSQKYYLVKCNCHPCSKVPPVTTHSNGDTLTSVFLSWRIWKTSQARRQFHYQPAWTASNQEKLRRELIASDLL